MRRCLPVLLLAFLVLPRYAFGQDPVVEPQQPVVDPLEEEFIAFRADVGQSHASGARPDLGPLVLPGSSRRRMIESVPCNGGQAPVFRGTARLAEGPD